MTRRYHVARFLLPLLLLLVLVALIIFGGINLGREFSLAVDAMAYDADLREYPSEDEYGKTQTARREKRRFAVCDFDGKTPEIKIRPLVDDKGPGTRIDVSGFVSAERKNSADLVAFVENACNSGWGYTWGTYGNILTEEELAYKIRQFPTGVGDKVSLIRANWLDRRTTDCVGLIKCYGWLNTDTLSIERETNGMPDVDADSMYYAAKESGPIRTIPEIPGLAVWHSGHIGVYVGNGEVIEAMGTAYGVVRTKLSERSFTRWLKIPYIDYN